MPAAFASLPWGQSQIITRLGIQLRDGLNLTVRADDADDSGNPDDLMADAVIRYNEDDKCWVAQVKWEEVKNRSEREAETPRSSNGHGADSEEETGRSLEIFATRASGTRG
jgi:hypothetical protein